MTGSPDNDGFMTPDEVRAQIEHLDDRQKAGADFRDPPETGIMKIVERMLKINAARLDKRDGNPSHKDPHSLREGENVLVERYVREIPILLIDQDSPITAADILSALRRTVDRAFSLMNRNQAPHPNKLLNMLYRAVVSHMNLEKDNSRKKKLQEMLETIELMLQSRDQR